MREFANLGLHLYGGVPVMVAIIFTLPSMNLPLKKGCNVL